MAEDEMNLPEPDAPPPIYGVRRLASPDLTFVRASSSAEIHPGDWVSVEIDGTHSLARVVITPDLSLRCEVVDAALAELRIVTESERYAHGEMGFLAPPAPSFGGPGTASFQSGATTEDDRFRQEKRQYPLLGSPVETPDGLGVLVGLNLMKHSATVRFDIDGDARVYAVTDGVLHQNLDVSKTGDPG